MSASTHPSRTRLSLGSGLLVAALVTLCGCSSPLTAAAPPAPAAPSSSPPSTGPAGPAAPAATQPGLGSDVTSWAPDGGDEVVVPAGMKRLEVRAPAGVYAAAYNAGRATTASAVATWVVRANPTWVWTKTGTGPMVHLAGQLVTDAAQTPVAASASPTDPFASTSVAPDPFSSATPSPSPLETATAAPGRGGTILVDVVTSRVGVLVRVVHAAP